MPAFLHIVAEERDKVMATAVLSSIMSINPTVETSIDLTDHTGYHSNSAGLKVPLIMSGSLRYTFEFLLGSRFRAVVLLNPEIEKEMKEKLYLVRTPVLILSCRDDMKFDSAATSLHDLISASKMKILHRCSEKNLKRTADSIAKSVLDFLSDEGIV